MHERAEELAETDPLWRAVLTRLEQLEARAEDLAEDDWDPEELREAEQRAEEIEQIVESFVQELRVDAATAWARGEQIVCDTLETAAGRLQAIL